MTTFITLLTAVLAFLALVSGFVFFYFARKSKVFFSLSLSFVLVLLALFAFHLLRFLQPEALLTAWSETFLVITLVLFSSIHYNVLRRTKSWF